MISERLGRSVKCKWNDRLMAVKRKWHHLHRDWFHINLAFTARSSLPIQLGEKKKKMKDKFRHKGSTSAVSDRDRKGGGVFSWLLSSGNSGTTRITVETRGAKEGGSDEWTDGHSLDWVCQSLFPRSYVCFLLPPGLEMVPTRHSFC